MDESQWAAQEENVQYLLKEGDSNRAVIVPVQLSTATLARVST